MEIIVLNKQRQHKVSLASLKKMGLRLSTAIFSNLKESQPIWIKATTIAALKQRTFLSLIIVSKSTIRKLNKKWLGKDKVTDVLSFPLLDICSANALKVNAPAGKQELGEIFIAYEKACEQAREYNHSIDRELAFLFVHGVLHILGFDHQDERSEKDMFKRQRQILKQAGYERSKK